MKEMMSVAQCLLWGCLASEGQNWGDWHMS